MARCPRLQAGGQTAVAHEIAVRTLATVMCGIFHTSHNEVFYGLCKVFFFKSDNWVGIGLTKKNI